MCNLVMDVSMCTYHLTSIQGLSGQPLSGPDIGGYGGNATPKLFGRWMGLGAMFPFCRGHSEAGTIDKEPWSFGEEVCPHPTKNLNCLEWSQLICNIIVKLGRIPISYMAWEARY